MLESVILQVPRVYVLQRNEEFSLAAGKSTGIELRVDMAGKVSSALTMVATGGAILLDQTWVDVLFWVSVALAVATLLNYSREAATALRTGRTASTRP